MVTLNKASLRIGLAMAIFSVFTHKANAQDVLAGWEFTGNNGDEVTVTATTLAPNISATSPSSVIVRGSGISPAANPDSYNADTWITSQGDNSTLSYAVTNNKYMEFSIAPVMGYVLTIDSIVFNWQKSNNGPGSLTLRSNQDGYTTDLDTKTGLANTNDGLKSVLSGFVGVQSTVTFRLYGYAATNRNSLGGFEGAGTDVLIYGSTAYANDSDIAADPTFVYPTSISYIDYIVSSSTMNPSNSIAVLGLTLRDGGSAATTDGRTTTLTSITFSTNGSTAVRAAALDAGSGLIGATQVNGATSFTMDLSGSPISAGDGGTANFQLYVTFTEGDLITDNEQVIYTVTAAEADPSGTLFEAADAGGAQSSNAANVNTTIVTADNLQLLQQPVNFIYLNEDITIETEATDALGTRDLDKYLEVSVSSGTGSVSSVSGLTQNTSTGTALWSDLRYDTEESDIRFAVNDVDGIVSEVVTELLTARPRLTVYTFAGAAGSEATFPADFQPTSGSALAIGRGSAINPAALSEAFSADNWPIPPISGFDPNSYFEFTLTANTGFTIDISAVEFDHSRSGSGPVSWQIRNSTDNYTALQGGSIAGTDTWNRDQLVNFSITGESSVTFRIYAYNATNSAGTWSLDNIEIFGEIRDTQPPSFIAGYPQADSARIDGFHLRASTDEPVTAYYQVKMYADPVPTDPNDIINGIGGVQNGSFLVNTTASDIVTGLSVATAYDIYWVLDDGVSAPVINASQIYIRTSDETATVASPTSQIASATIPTTANSVAEAVDVFSFEISDNSTVVGDLASTNVSKIWIKNPDASTDWTAVLAGVTLSGSTLGDIPLEDTRIYADSIVIDVDPANLVIADQGSETITMAVYVVSSGITDGTTIQFEISQTDPGQVFAASAYGTQFDDPFASTTVASNVHTIDVDADRLLFTSVPALVSGDNEIFSVTVQAIDANGNLDVDEISSIVLSRGLGTGILASASSLTQSMTGGIVTWNDLTYDGPQGTGETFTLVATDNATILQQATSPTIIFVKAGDLVVSSGNSVTISGAEAYTNVTIEDNATLNLGSGASLTISGDFSINGANGIFNDLGGTTYFEGNVAQVIQSDQPGKTVDFYNMDISNSHAGGLTSELNINLHNTLQLRSGTTFDANGSGANDYNFTLVSTPTSTARIATIEDGATLSGNIVWQRSLRAGPEGWRNVGTPIKGQTVSDWRDDVRIQGIAEYLPGSWPNFYYYVESMASVPNNGSDGWVKYTQDADPVNVGIGSNLRQWSSDYNPTLTVINKGLPTIGNGSDETGAAGEVYNFPVSFTPTGYDGGGWNLLANPYPCELDWDAAEFVHTNIEGNAVHVWNPALQQYAVYNGTESINGGSQYIASGQAFFVKAIDGTAVVSVSENAKSTADGNSFLREAAVNYASIKVKVKSAANHMDETIVTFRSDAQHAYEPALDARKSAGGMINISSVVEDDRLLSINAMGVPTGRERIKINLEPYYFGAYTLQFPSIKHVEDNFMIRLIDNYLDKTVEVDETTTYDFVIEKGNAATYGSERFELQLLLPAKLSLQEDTVRAGQEVIIPVRVQQLAGITDMNIALGWDQESLAFTRVNKVDMGDRGYFDLSEVQSGQLRFEFESQTHLNLPDSAVLFELHFNALNGTPHTDLVFDVQRTKLTAEQDLDMPFSIDDATIRILQNRVISGRVSTTDNVPVNGVTLNARGDAAIEGISGDGGEYALEAHEHSSYMISASKDQKVNVNEGISTVDVILAHRHLLNVDRLDNPYQVIAADVNFSKSVSALDLAQLRKIVLGIDKEFEGGLSWLFIDGGLDLSGDPFSYEQESAVSLDDQDLSLDFVAVKIGDVNNSWAGNGAERMSQGQVAFDLEQPALVDGSIELPVTLKNFRDISGFQFSIQWDPAQLEYDGMKNAKLDGHYNELFVEEGIVSVMWHEPRGRSLTLLDGTTAFALRFKARKEDANTQVELNSALTKAIAIDTELNTLSIESRSTSVVLSELGTDDLELFQNTPNPFGESTSIEFRMARKGVARISIFNMLGEVVYQHEQAYAAGVHRHIWKVGDAYKAIHPGVYMYQLESGGEKRVRKMVIR